MLVSACSCSCSCPWRQSRRKTRDGGESGSEGGSEDGSDLMLCMRVAADLSSRTAPRRIQAAGGLIPTMWPVVGAG